MTISCSFCRKPEDDANVMLQGSRAVICDACVVWGVAVLVRVQEEKSALRPVVNEIREIVEGKA